LNPSLSLESEVFDTLWKHYIPGGLPLKEVSTQDVYTIVEGIGFCLVGEAFSSTK
jgi:hypothetical protein